MSKKYDIVIVEDSPIQAELLKRILVNNGFNVIVSKDGADGLDKIGSHRPDLVVSDISMPIMDGYEMCRRVKNNPELSGTPIILLTQLTDPKEIISGLDAGADNYITKPYEENTLIASIRFLLENPIKAASEDQIDGIDIVFEGNHYIINSNRQQILNLLLSTYESAVRKNRQLQTAQMELKVLNEQLERKVVELQAINRELNDFAHIVSHDLKAPVRAIGSLSGLMLEDYGNILPEKGIEMINLISRRVARMYNLIDGLLRYTNIGYNRKDMVITDMNEVVAGVIELIELPAGFRIDSNGRLPRVKCEKNRIEHVFLNLVTNAVKHLDRKDGVIQISCKEENFFWKFCVSDNGPGIDEKYFEKIFQIFQTLKPRDEFETTGVGLSIVKKIVTLHGGKVWVESKPGDGASFYFTLPKSA